MIKLDTKNPIRISDLNNRVTFFEYQENDGPEPGEKEKRTLFTCRAKVDEVWLKDMEMAKWNNTMSDLTITIRDPRRNYSPTNKHYLEIDDINYKDKRYNIKHVQPDVMDKRFINIVAELK